MDSTRRTSFITGVLFIITFVTSIPAALVLYTPVLDDANFILGAGADGGVALGAFLEVLLIVANVGTAVALFPILKRQNEPLALGYVTARLVECTFIAIGIVSLLAVVAILGVVLGVRREPAGCPGVRHRGDRAVGGREDERAGGDARREWPVAFGEAGHPARQPGRGDLGDSRPARRPRGSAQRRLRR